MDQRYGFGVLCKLVMLWVDPFPLPPVTPKSPAVVPSPVPGFERFIYENVIGMCFEIPLKRSFDYSDAQSYQARSIHLFHHLLILMVK